MDDDKGINKVKWLSWQKNFNESNKIFYFYSLNSLIFKDLIFFRIFLHFWKYSTVLEKKFKAITVKLLI